MAGVEVVLYRVVVGGGGYHHKVGVGIGCTAVEGGSEVERLFSQILFDVVVLYGRDVAVEFFHLFGHHVNGCHVMVLRQQGGYAQGHIACASYGNTYIFELAHIYMFITPHALAVKGDSNNSEIGICALSEVYF
ncbi:unknown [Prevotella sp. CAG:5226]|nr:unknown [Prevotella sp. CAG:5226]